MAFKCDYYYVYMYIEYGGIKNEDVYKMQQGHE